MIVTALQAELDKRTGPDDEPTDRQSRRSNVLTTDELIALAISGDIPLAKWSRGMLTDALAVLRCRQDEHLTRFDDCVALIASITTQAVKAGSTASAKAWLGEFGLEGQCDEITAHVGAQTARHSAARGTGARR